MMDKISLANQHAIKFVTAELLRRTSQTYCHGSSWRMPWTGIREVWSGEVARVRVEGRSHTRWKLRELPGDCQMYSDTEREWKFAIPYMAQFFTIYTRA